MDELYVLQKMKRTFIAILITMSIFSKLFGSESEDEPSVPNKVITIEQLEGMFTNMAKNPGWNLKEPLLWGYFFTNDTPEPLEKAKKSLIGSGYRFVDIFISDKDSPDDPDLFWLHVEKEEVHTPSSLDKTNNKFYILAHKLGLKSYDGMDVGLISKKQGEQVVAPDRE